jgi:hypothetical protein
MRNKTPNRNEIAKAAVAGAVRRGADVRRGLPARRGGQGDWWECASVYSGWCDEHPRDGRELIKPSTPEWYTMDTQGSER